VRGIGSGIFKGCEEARYDFKLQIYKNDGSRKSEVVFAEMYIFQRFLDLAQFFQQK
jgi:hypothetical protein